MSRSFITIGDKTGPDGTLINGRSDLSDPRQGRDGRIGDLIFCDR
ncbi:hypothetical protein ACTOWA_09295 [Herbaspirillum seropedicae]